MFIYIDMFININYLAEQGRLYENVNIQFSILFCLSSSCVSYVTSFSGWSICDAPSVFSNVYSFSGWSICDAPSVFSNVYSLSGWSMCDAPSVFSNVYLHFLWMVYL